jgi:hypothetical protein
MIKPLKSPVRPYAVTLVNSKLAGPPQELSDWSIRHIHRIFTDCLGKAKVLRGVAVLEVGLVEHRDERYPSQWLPQLHGVVFTRDPNGLKKRLKRVFQATDMVPRPVHVESWNGDQRYLRYCHKLETQCRVGVDDATRYDFRRQQPRKCRTTERRKLTADERLELLLFHDRISLDSRILTKGAQLRLSSNDCRMIRLRRPKRRIVSNRGKTPGRRLRIFSQK